MASNVQSLSYSGTNVTTGAYVTFVAVTPIACSQIVLSDSSGAVIKLAVGAAASEVDLAVMPLSGAFVLSVGLNVIPAGSRLSLRAISGTASTGYATVSFLP